jgi:predicted transcriptional regulator
MRIIKPTINQKPQGSASDHRESSFVLKVAEITSGWLSGNKDFPLDHLYDLILSIGDQVRQSSGGQIAQENATTGSIHPDRMMDRTPAVPVAPSVFSDKIICLFCGKPMQILTKHITSNHGGMRPDTYRRFWCLPDNYPMMSDQATKTRASCRKRPPRGSVTPAESDHV